MYVTDPTETIESLVIEQKKESAARAAPSGEHAAFVASLITMVTIFAVDLVAPPAFSLGLLYIVPVLLMGETSRGWWVTAKCVLSMAFIVAAMMSDFASGNLVGSAWAFNRGVSICMILLFTLRAINKCERCVKR